MAARDDLTLYVQSCGFAPAHEYQWVRVLERSQLACAPGLYELLRVGELIQTEAPSVVIARAADGRLLLACSGLRSSRKDFRGRPVRNAFALEAPAEWEPRLRTVAAEALRGRLDADVDRAVEGADGETGFRARFEAFAGLLERAAAAGSEAADPRRKVGNVEEQREALAAELEASALPEGTGVLVAATGIKDPAALDAARVWRGLTKLAERGGWKVSAPAGSQGGQKKKSLPPPRAGGDAGSGARGGGGVSGSSGEIELRGGGSGGASPRAMAGRTLRKMGGAFESVGNTLKAVGDALEEPERVVGQLKEKTVSALEETERVITRLEERALDLVEEMAPGAKPRGSGSGSSGGGGGGGGKRVDGDDDGDDDDGVKRGRG